MDVEILILDPRSIHDLLFYFYITQAKKKKKKRGTELTVPNSCNSSIGRGYVGNLNFEPLLPPHQ